MIFEALLTAEMKFLEYATGCCFCNWLTINKAAKRGNSVAMNFNKEKNSLISL